MNIKNNELKIFYLSKLDRKLDETICNAIKKHGYEFYGSGYDLNTSIRDMAFDKKKKKVKNRIWNIAEYMNWHNLPPRKMWEKILYYYDKKGGYINNKSKQIKINCNYEKNAVLKMKKNVLFAVIMRKKIMK